MNIVSNSCIGAYLMRDYYKYQYNNPFCWTFILVDDFVTLMNEWDNINFMKYTLEKRGKRLEDGFKTIIDGKVTLLWYHYLFSMKYNKPTTKGINVFSDKIWEYIIEKYEERTKRMLAANEKPIFIFADSYNYKCEGPIEERRKKIEGSTTPYKKFFFDSNDYNYHNDNKGFTKAVYEVIKDKI
jgi:uncharacterized protein (DUF1919 family)